MDKNKKYLVFIIQAHEGETPQMTLMDSCTIELIDDSVDSAMKRAKILIKKKHYRIKSIIEQYAK